MSFGLDRLLEHFSQTPYPSKGDAMWRTETRTISTNYLRFTSYLTGQPIWVREDAIVTVESFLAGVKGQREGSRIVLPHAGVRELIAVQETVDQVIAAFTAEVRKGSE